MLYEVFEPPAELAPYVRFFWALEGEVSSGERYVHRSLADGCVEMVFHYRSAFDEITSTGSVETSPLASIQAQSTRYRRFVTQECFGIFGAYLYPFAIPRLFTFPAYEFTNITPDLESVFGNEGRLLGEQVCSASDNSARIGIVSDFFRSRLRKTKADIHPVFHSIHQVLRSKGLAEIDTLASDQGLSRRQFERRFKELAGLTPKLYSRVVRFQAATEQKVLGTKDLTEIAYSCGYYDQSHFINDFREFSGYTPKEYFWDVAEGTQYLDV
jgi:AraC-like DNA-binding protein